MRWALLCVLAMLAVGSAVTGPAAHAQSVTVISGSGASDAETAAAAKAFGEKNQPRFQEIPWIVLLPIGLFLVLLLSWIGTTDWVNRDSQIFGLNYKKWVPIAYAPVAVLAIVLAFVPINFWIKLPLLAVAYLASFLPYAISHNRSVEPHQTVLTGSWWRHLFAAVMGKVGVKVKTERLAEYEKGAPVELIAMGGESASDDNVNLLTARQSPGYLVVKEVVLELVNRRAERMMLDYGQQGVAVRYQVDGVWHPGEARDRESGDVALAVMKTLANLDASDRRTKQVGRLGAKYQGNTYMCELTTQGTQGGERAILHMLFEKARPSTYNELGMREGLQQKWGELMAADRGLLIFSAMPAGGLTTMIDASLNETDRLMRDFVAIEEVNHREHEIQNVNVTTYDAAQGQSAITILPTLIRTYPNVYILRDFTPPEAAKSLIGEIQDERLVITSVQARDAPEALIRMLQMKVPQKAFAAAVTAVLYQRLIRTLCPDCKVGYTPPPDVLKKLGIPPGKIEQLYRPPKPEELEKPCPTCSNIGYLGRTGIFELLEVTDQMREILVKQPSVDLLRKAARASQQRSLQEEGILLVAKGVTSLPELMRVLKG
ncbi:MAG: Flp pilus assembly complex ATPase component TadA [Planctomycetales bacterium]|nr:Flp pilus assembly complex ATPase component TadA [Planctomycetales bacterium]